MTLHIQVVTPEKVLVDEEALEVIVPTISGEISVLPHHVPLITQLASGELIIKKNNSTEHLVVIGGFLEISEKTVTILADHAVSGKDISAVKAQEAKERAEKAMKENKNNKNFAIAQAEFLKAILELKIAGKIKRHS